MSREVVPRPTLPHSLHRNGRFARGFVMRVLWVDPHNNAKILVRLVRIRTVVMLDEHEVFARERGYTGFDVRGGPRRRETVRQRCDEAGAPVGV